METKRLKFRELVDDDFCNLKAILSDEQTMKFYPKPYDDNGVSKWIAWCKACYQKRGFGLFAIILKSTGEFIGDCGITLQNINGKEVFEVGYHINKKFWNEGYGKEASQFMKDYFFENTEYDEVYSYMNYLNVPSRILAIKNGMKLVEEYLDDGVLHSVYKITRLEWKKDRK